MAKKETPDPERRPLFELFRDPERLGRVLGRAYREMMEALNPPAVSPEEYQQALEQIKILESQVKELEAQRAQDAALSAGGRRW